MVLGAPEPAPVDRRQIIICNPVLLLGRRFQPPRRLGVILLHALALQPQPSEPVLRRGDARFGRFAEPRGSLLGVLLYPPSLGVKPTQPDWADAWPRAAARRYHAAAVA